MFMVDIQNKIAILVDFDNWYPNVLKSEDETKILNLLNNVINQIIPDSEEFEYISIGMYGGWYTGNVLTQKASVLSSMLPRLQNIFPFRKMNSQVLIQGEIKLATQLYDDETIWYNSYREHVGIPKLRIKTEKIGSICNENSKHCPVHILQNFTKNKSSLCRVNTCDTKHSEVFFTREQKYVDSMIVCDILSYGVDPSYHMIVVLSEDCDMYPAFAALHRLNAINHKETRLELFVRNNEVKQNNQTLLNQFGVNINLINI